jgi:hypothetical protein
MNAAVSCRGFGTHCQDAQDQRLTGAYLNGGRHLLAQPIAQIADPSLLLSAKLRG